jgi:hypothetical protein
MSNDELRFSAQFWPKGTSVRMINVPWDGSYKDIVQFDNANARDAWLDERYSAPMSTTSMTYVGPGTSIVLPCPVTTAEQYNYLYVQNPSYSITDGIDEFDAINRRYCYFITDIAWVSTAACQVTLQLDVWTTWGPFVHFTRAFVAQGHAAIANRNLWDGTSLSQITPAKMRRYLAATESVDAGGTFVPIETRWTDLSIETTGNQGVFVGVMSSVDLSQNWGTVNNPNIKTASGSIQEGMLAGTQVVYFKPDDFIDLLDDLRDAPWVSRNIMQVWVAPALTTTMQMAGVIHGKNFYRPGQKAPFDIQVDTLNAMTYLMAHYSAADTLVAPKLLTAPFAFIEVSAFEGSPLILKPERVADLTSIKFMAKSVLMAPWNRIAIYPDGYGSGNGGSMTYSFKDIQGDLISRAMPYGDYLDSAVWIDELPTFSFTSDGYMNWLAQGSHARKWSYQNTEWNFMKSNITRQFAFNQGIESMDLAEAQYNEMADFHDKQRLINSIGTGVGGLSLDIVKDIGQVGATTLNHFIQQGQANVERAQFAESQALQRKQADQNNRLAAQAAKGDYEFAIAGLVASQRDAEITPPSVVGTAGGNGWNYAFGMVGYRTTIKVPAAGQEKILIGYFKRFGYAINELLDMPADLRLMTKFTYWKLQESFIYGNITESAKQAIRGIFEKGVTVWNDPDDITTFRYSDNSNGINQDNSFSY